MDDKPARIDKSARADRITTVITLRLNGASTPEILRYALNPPWACSKRQAYRYIQAADDWFSKNSDSDRLTMFGIAKARLEGLYRDAKSTGDLKLALAVQKEINTLLGLYPAAKIEHSGKIDFVTACLEADRIFNAGGSGEAVDGS